MILEEIAMNDDDPGDAVHDAFAAQLFGDSPLGRPILGTIDSINSITRGVLPTTTAGTGPESLVVAVAGSVDHDAVVDLVRRRSGAFSARRPGARHGFPGLGLRRPCRASGWCRGGRSRRMSCSAATGWRGATSGVSLSACCRRRWVAA